MIKIDAQGRLAFMPEVKMVGANSRVCDFRLLTSRWDWVRKVDVVEAVNFVCWNEEADNFCRNTVKGQLISATGVQETTESVDQVTGQKRIYVKYLLTWWHGGPKPQGASQGGNGSNAERRGEYQPNDRPQAARPTGQQPRGQGGGYQARPRADAQGSAGGQHENGGNGGGYAAQQQRSTPPPHHEDFQGSGHFGSNEEFL